MFPGPWAFLSASQPACSTKTVPIGTAYAVWTGIGALGTVVVGMIWYHEPANLLRMLLLVTLIGAVAGLKLTAGH
ncbi:multidrug efflux SMR transporter [Citrobacter freundii]